MYYLIEIATGDEKIAGKGIYTYNTRTEALASYHSKLGVAMKSPMYQTELVMVIDDAGAVEVSHKFIREAAEA